MSSNARFAAAGIRKESTDRLVRRAALFLGMLMSGGILLLPRIPLLGLIAALFLVWRSPVALARRELAPVWLLMVAVLCVGLIGGGAFYFEATATRYANFLGGLMLLCFYLDKPRGTLDQDIVPLLRLMAVQAIVTVFLTVFARDFFRPLVYNDLTYQTIGLVFTYHETIDGTGFLQRPDGFFYEPGVFQIYLNVLLYIALFSRPNRRDVILALAGVVATQSTTGIGTSIMLLLSAYLWRIRVRVGAQKVLVALLAPLVIVPIVLIGYQNFTEKTVGAYQGSAMARQYDLQTGLRVAAEYPLTGIGFDNDRYLEESVRLAYFDTSLDINEALQRPNSNGIVSLAFTVGLPMFMVFMLALFRQRFFERRLVVFALFFLSLIGESLGLTPFFLMFMFSGLLLPKKVSVARSPPLQLRSS